MWHTVVVGSFNVLLRVLYGCHFILLSILILSINHVGVSYNYTKHLYKNDTNYKDSTRTDPVIIWWTDIGHGPTSLLHCPNINASCKLANGKKRLGNEEGAYLFYGSSIKWTDLPLPRSDKHIWGLLHEESPRNVEELLHDAGITLFNFTSTFSRFSDVRFPLQYMGSLNDITSDQYFVSTHQKNQYLNQSEIAPILYIQSDCCTSTERDQYVSELMKLIKIDSYGKCLKNRKMPNDLLFDGDYLNNLKNEKFYKFVARYKFAIAIENGICDDYITEKFWRNIEVGTVPIYFGSPSIKLWLPNKKSAILLEDYPTPVKLINHINDLLNNDSLYESYLEHKTKKAITNEGLIREITRVPKQNIYPHTEFECLICERLHKRRQGDMTEYVADRNHYRCPEPISALTLQVNERNEWVPSYWQAKKSAENIYNRIFSYRNRFL